MIFMQAGRVGEDGGFPSKVFLKCIDIKLRVEEAHVVTLPSKPFVVPNVITLREVSVNHTIPAIGGGEGNNHHRVSGTDLTI